MSILYINLNLLDYSEEAFSIEIDNILNDDIFLVDSLSFLEKEVYNNFIDLIGFTNLILTDVELTNATIFNRIKLFDHDENYNILNLRSDIKSYNDYSEKDKNIINAFLLFLQEYNK